MLNIYISILLALVFLVPSALNTKLSLGGVP
jgi:hypothetical protein